MISESNDTAKVKAEELPASSSTSKTSSSKQAEVIAQAILDTLEEDTMDQSWKIALEPEFKKPYFLKVRPYT